MTRRHTCARCPHLSANKIGRLTFYSCLRTGNVVPHHANDMQATFWRVPLDCPLPSSSVVKSADKAPRRAWVTIRHA